MRVKIYRWIAIRRISQIIMVVLTLFLAGNFTYADAQTGPDIRLVLQVTIDGLRADLINRFILAPGFDYRQDRHDFLFRAGVGYEFEIDRWSISPEFNVDFVDGEQVLVYGLSFGYGF